MGLKLKKHFIKTKGSPGADKITNKAIKNLQENYIEYIAIIINVSLKLSYVPSTWKHETITMIPKPMKDHTKPENHRPISLLNTLAKLAGKVMQKRLNKWIQTNNIISNFQSSFVKGRQTNDHLFRFIELTL